MSRLLSLAALVPALAFAQTQTATPPATSSQDAAQTQAQAATPPATTAQPAQPAPAPAPKPKVKVNGNAQEEAGDTSELAHDIGPLKNRIPPVTGHVFLTKGRFELSPEVGFSLKDSFFTKYIFGAELAYHATETLAFDVHAGYSKASISGAAQICTTDGCRSPTMDEVNGRAPGQVTGLGGADVQWSPIYGKIALLAESFLHFNLYGRAGVAAVQYAGPADVGSEKKIALGGELGLGARFFINRWVTVRTELGDVIYPEKLQDKSNPLRQQLMFQLGVSFFFPMGFTEG